MVIKILAHPGPLLSDKKIQEKGQRLLFAKILSFFGRGRGRGGR